MLTVQTNAVLILPAAEWRAATVGGAQILPGAIVAVIPDDVSPSERLDILHGLAQIRATGPQNTNQPIVG